MITLHHLRIGRSIFTVWLLEEIGADYQLKIYQRDGKMRAPDELKNIHPLGKSPVIEDGSLILSESSAITTYLLEKFDTKNKLHPPRSSQQQWGRFTQWLHYPEGSVFAPLLLKLLTVSSNTDHPLITPFSDAEIKLHFDHIKAQLGDNEYILGAQFSAADVGIAYVISMAERLNLLTTYPTLQHYLQRMTSRAAFKRAIANAVE